MKRGARKPTRSVRPKRARVIDVPEVDTYDLQAKVEALMLAVDAQGKAIDALTRAHNADSATLGKLVELANREYARAGGATVQEVHDDVNPPRGGPPGGGQEAAIVAALMRKNPELAGKLAGLGCPAHAGQWRFGCPACGANAKGAALAQLGLPPGVLPQ